MNTNIKKLRMQKRLTQKQLAEILNIKQTTVSEWENRRSYPRIEAALALADYFDVSLDYLLGKEDNSGITYPKKYIEASEEEKHIISAYRSLSDKGKFNANQMLNIIANGDEKNKNGD